MSALLLTSLFVSGVGLSRCTCCSHCLLLSAFSRLDCYRRTCFSSSRQTLSSRVGVGSV